MISRVRETITGVADRLPTTTGRLLRQLMESCVSVVVSPLSSFITRTKTGTTASQTIWKSSASVVIRSSCTTARRTCLSSPRRYSQSPGKPGIKTLNYGEGPKKLAEKLGVSVDEAKELIEMYFTPYPKVRQHITHIHKQARTGIIETILKRPRRFPELISLGEYDWWDLSGNEKMAVSRAERQSVNSEIQGSAADVMRMTMIKSEYDPDLRALGAEMLLQIHDELIFEVPIENVDECIPLIKEDMEHPFPFELAIPLQVDLGCGHSWAAAKA